MCKGSGQLFCHDRYIFKVPNRSQSQPYKFHIVFFYKLKHFIDGILSHLGPPFALLCVYVFLLYQEMFHLVMRIQLFVRIFCIRRQHGKAPSV